MKTPIEFAEYYLHMVLGDRKGFDISEVVGDDEIEEEIIQELTDLIEKRDKECAQENKHFYK